jgi:hypothetical protein
MTFARARFSRLASWHGVFLAGALTAFVVAMPSLAAAQAPAEPAPPPPDQTQTQPQGSPTDTGSSQPAQTSQTPGPQAQPQPTAQAPKRLLGRSSLLRSNRRLHLRRKNLRPLRRARTLR